MNRDVKTCAEWLTSEDARVFDGIPPHVIAAAQRLKAKPRKPTPRVAAPRNRTKQERRESRPERVAAIRRLAVERDCGMCVLCSEHATECHHLISGVGRRRVNEGLDNVAMLCQAHHLAAHRGNEWTLRDLCTWAQRMGYVSAAFALDRRIAKIHEARAAGRSTP